MVGDSEVVARAAAIGLIGPQPEEGAHQAGQGIRGGNRVAVREDEFGIGVVAKQSWDARHVSRVLQEPVGLPVPPLQELQRLLVPREMVVQISDMQAG